jgi:hypothetical protein
LLLTKLRKIFMIVFGSHVSGLYPVRCDLSVFQ